MQQTNKLIYIGFAIHILVSLISGIQEVFLLYILLVPLLANLIGLYFLSFTKKIKLGARLFMVSSFFFIPIGMVGIIGARKVLDKLNMKFVRKFSSKERGDRLILSVKI